jgi:hypothetical protein
MSPSVKPLLEAPWGAIIGVFFVLVGVATGVTLLALWVHPQDHMVVSLSNLGSPMSIGAKLIALKLSLLITYLYLLTRQQGCWLQEIPRCRGTPHRCSSPPFPRRLTS